MQTLSSALLLEQGNKTGILPYRIVELQRRYWNGSAFVWSSAVNISSYVKKVSTAKWKLDTRGFGEWKSPSFSVDLDNRRNFWSEIEARGVWRTGLSGSQTYYTDLSRIRVRLGHVLPDGTLEDKYAFGGLISKPLAHQESQRTVTAYCTGLDELLRRKSAEGLSTLVTLELLGSGSGTVFTTAQLGVGIVVVVKRGLTASGAAAATEQIPETDYTLSQLNEKALGAEVTLTSALTAGNSAWITYRYWYQDKDLSWIVEQLLDLAGVTDYQVDATVFSTSILTTTTRTSAAHFAAGVLQNIDATSTDGSFKKRWYKYDDWADGDFTAAPVWGGDTTGFSVSAGKLTAASPPWYTWSVGLSRATGTWEIKMDRSSGYASFAFMGGPTSGFFIIQPNRFKYWIRIDGATLYLYRGDPGADEVSPAVDTLLASVAYTSGAGDVYRVDRDAAGLMRVYVNDVLKITHTDNTYTTAGPAMVEASGNATFDDLYYCYEVVNEAHQTTTPLWTDAVLDCGVGLTSYGSVTFNYSPNDGTLLVETLSSTDSGFTALDPAGWVALSGIGLILSDVRRYLKVRITLIPAATVGVIIGPEIQDVSIRHYVSSTTMPLVDMTSKTCLSAIQEVAKYPGYEIGFTSTEQFFYRPRASSSSSVLTISASTNLLREVSFNDGTDQVYARVKATFGNYRVTIDSDVLGEAAPNALDKYGEQELSISSSLIPKEGANIADSAARSIYAYTSVPRKRAQVDMKFLIQYELGDRVTYQREHKHGRWTWGDPDRRYGDSSHPDFVYHADPAANGWDLPMRIEGIEFDTNPKAMKLKYDLVEIPS